MAGMEPNLRLRDLAATWEARLKPWMLVAALLAGAAPLILYPVILLAGVMSLAGHRTNDDVDLLLVISRTFVVASLAYPLVYGACLGGGLFAWFAAKKQGLAFALSVTPLGYFGVLVLLLMLWAAADVMR